MAPSSGSGGFFSGLWTRLKNVAGNLLGQAGTWLSSNMGGLISTATSFVSDKLGGLLTKAGGWLSGLISSWSQKLMS